MKGGVVAIIIATKRSESRSTSNELRGLGVLTPAGANRPSRPTVSRNARGRFGIVIIVATNRSGFGVIQSSFRMHKDPLERKRRSDIVAITSSM